MLLKISKQVYFLGAVAKLRKGAISFVTSAVFLSGRTACLSVRMEHLSSHWADFHEI
jgi:hypothetical protein